MLLKEFVSETLTEILDGVVDARKHFADNGGSATPNIAYVSTDQKVDTNTQRPVERVEFDVAITEASGLESKGATGVHIAILAAGLQGSSSTSNSSVSRVKFSIPILLPTDPVVHNPAERPQYETSGYTI